MLICFCSAKFLLKSVHIVPFSNDHNIVSSLICRCQNKPPMKFLDPFLHMSKVNLGLLLTFLLDNIFIQFGTKLYRQVVGIPMDPNCALLVADLFLFCYERDFMMLFNTTSRYLHDILNINNVYFDNMVSHIYPLELKLNKANASDTEATFLDLHLSISNDIVSTKIYDKRDDFDFEIVIFPFLDGDVPPLHPMESIYLNSFALLEHLAMLLTSTLAINC